MLAATRRRRVFGKPRQIKKLEVNLLATQTLFGLYGKLPPDKQRLAMQNNPRDLAEGVRRAVAAGHAVQAREMVEATSTRVPAGVTAEQWANIMRHAFDELP
jgi:hypothetical protein